MGLWFREIGREIISTAILFQPLIYLGQLSVTGGVLVNHLVSKPVQKKLTGRGSSIGSEFAWHVSGPEFDPHVRHILSCRLGHENISTAILPLPLIQEEQLSVTGERKCTKYW